jgi:hypothetical protein
MFQAVDCSSYHSCGYIYCVLRKIFWGSDAMAGSRRMKTKMYKKQADFILLIFRILYDFYDRIHNPVHIGIEMVHREDENIIYN